MAAIATEHNDVAAAVNKRAGHSGEVVDSREQPAKHTFPHGLGTNVRIAIRERIALCFVPVDGGIHRREQQGRIVPAECRVRRLDRLDR